MRRALPMLLALAASASGADRADERDPLRWPAELRQALAAPPPAAGSAPAPVDTRIQQVVFENGRGHVVSRGRRLAVGDSLDGARIERITEQAVWLREDGQLRRVPLYGGIEKQAAAASAARNPKEKP